MDYHHNMRESISNRYRILSVPNRNLLKKEISSVTICMRRNLKEQILKLRSEGKTLREIKRELNCSLNTVSYHLYDAVKRKQKKNAKKFSQSEKGKTYKKQWYSSPFGIICNKIAKFSRLHTGRKKKFIHPSFSPKEILEKYGNEPTCYITGLKIDLCDPKSYCLDHIIPLSKGGTSNLNNCGLCLPEINAAKSDKTPEQFFELCKLVLQKNGYKIEKIPVE